MADYNSQEELISKYKLAGRIRFITFSLLFFFLLLMKLFAKVTYLNSALITFIFIEALINQPYNFIIRRVNVYRFQYYQMITDIITITWVLYYMGGIEAPVVSIAYYGVILWAGVVSTTQAVFFAVTASVIFFTLIVVFEHIGILPFISYNGNYRMSTAQVLSLLLSNISFLFAFGYFSARSSKIIKFLERKRQEETLRNVHKLAATGYLVTNTAHDILNNLANIKGYIKLLLDRTKEGSEEDEMLKSIERLEYKCADSLNRLSRFSQKPEPVFVPTDINKTIEDALRLTWPLVKYVNIAIEKAFALEVPLIMADKDQLQEVFVVLILNSLDAIAERGKIIIKTDYHKESGVVEMIFSDNGRGIKQEDLKRIGEPFFTTKGQKMGLGLGLAIVYEIISRHEGKIEVDSRIDQGTTFTIRLPVNRVAVSD